jgi:transcriptional antiterminator NusG
MAETKTRWYVIRVVGGKERKTKEFIELELSRQKLDVYVEQILIPTEKIYQIRKGKKISKERNYFPGYILVEAALVGEVEHVIKSTTNVMGFLSAVKRGDPMPIRQAEVNRILGKVDELTEEDAEMNIPYVVGESIKVVDGPFNNFNGVIEEIQEEKKKLKVMVKIFGRRTPLELSYMQVEKEG